MSNWAIALLTGRRMSPRCQQLLRKDLQLSPQLSHSTLSSTNNTDLDPLHQQEDTSSYSDDGASTTSVAVSFTDKECEAFASLDSYPRSSPSSCLKIKTQRESLQQQRESLQQQNEPPLTTSYSPGRKRAHTVAFSSVTVHYHSSVFVSKEDTPDTTTIRTRTSSTNSSRQKRGRNVSIALGWKRLNSKNYDSVTTYELQRSLRRRRRRRNPQLAGETLERVVRFQTAKPREPTLTPLFAQPFAADTRIHNHILEKATASTILSRAGQIAIRMEKFSPKQTPTMTTTTPKTTKSRLWRGLSLSSSSSSSSSKRVNLP